MLKNIYAFILAKRFFRTLIAIAACFDLELIEYDAVNAFVNALLPYDVFIKMLPGYRKKEQIFHLKKALYGLRKALLLWQKKFTATFKKLDFEMVPHKPCCYKRKGILIFFYVDDIVVAYGKKQQKEVDEAIRSLREIYHLTGGKDLQ